MIYGMAIFASVANLFDGLTATLKFLFRDVLPIYWSLMNAVS